MIYKKFRPWIPRLIVFLWISLVDLRHVQALVENWTFRITLKHRSILYRKQILHEQSYWNKHPRKCKTDGRVRHALQTNTIHSTLLHHLSVPRPRNQTRDLVTSRISIWFLLGAGGTQSNPPAWALLRELLVYRCKEVPEKRPAPLLGRNGANCRLWWRNMKGRNENIIQALQGTDAGNRSKA